MDLELLSKDAELRRAIANSLKQKEKPESTKERMKKVLSKRDEAMKLVTKIQDETGIPSEDEVKKQFFNENKLMIDVDEFNSKENEE